MRLKNVDAPLSIYGNDIVNSPKRNNTIQNSNLNVKAIYKNTNINYNTNDNCDNVVTAINSTDSDRNTLDNLNNGGNAALQWYNETIQETIREEDNNIQNRKQLYNIDSKLAVPLENSSKQGRASSVYSESSPDDSLLEYEDVHQSCSSTDSSSQQGEDRIFDISDCESLSEDINLTNSGSVHQQRRGIVNPNYPGFQHLAHTLDYSIKTSSDTDFTDEDEDFEREELRHVRDTNNINNNNINNNTLDKIDGVNRLDSDENTQKVFHDKDVFNIPLVEEKLDQIQLDNNNFPQENSIVDQNVQVDLERAVEKLISADDLKPTASGYTYEPNVDQPFNKNIDELVIEMKVPVMLSQLPEETLKLKFSDAVLSDVQDCVPFFYENLSDVNLNDLKESTVMEFDMSDTSVFQFDNDLPGVDSYSQQKKVYDRSGYGQNKIITTADQNEDANDEKFCKEDKTKDEPEKDEDSAVPRKKERIDLGFVPRREHCGKNRENHNRHTIPGLLREGKTANSEFFGGFDVYNIETAMPKIDLEAIEWHLRAAREEERRRRTDREEIRKRLAMGAEDDHYHDRPGRKPSLQARLQSGMNLQICFMNETVSDNESPSSDTESPVATNFKMKSTRSKNEREKILHPVRPASLAIGQTLMQRVAQPSSLDSDFFARQGRLQTEARMALAQAKEMARMQMQIERQRQETSPIAEMVRHSLEKVGIPFPQDRRRLSRQILTEMNLAQLQVIVNDLHSQIETLNENLVKFLMHRDDLHMEQDSMLVDIEDLTRYLGAKEQSFKEQNQSTIQNNNMTTLSSPAAGSLSLPSFNVTHQTILKN